MATVLASTSSGPLIPAISFSKCFDRPLHLRFCMTSGSARTPNKWFVSYGMLHVEANGSFEIVYGAAEMWC